MVETAATRPASSNAHNPARLWRLTALLAPIAAIIAALTPANASADTIRWRVENPFRYFTDPAATRIHASALRAAAEAQDPILAAERALAARFPRGWAERAFLQTCWNVIRQDFSRCGGLTDYVFPGSHRIEARLARGATGRRARCTWTVTSGHLQGAVARNSRRPSRRDQVVEAGCGETVRLDIPYPAGALVRVARDGQPVAQEAVRVRDLLVAGIGDSYASGEGNPDYPVRWRDDRTESFGRLNRRTPLDGYPARAPSTITVNGRQLQVPSAFWHSQPCHRSLYSHQLRAALALSLRDAHSAVTYLGLSCSGAQVTTGLLERYKGTERFRFAPKRSQIGDVAVAQCGGRGYGRRNYAARIDEDGQSDGADVLGLERCPPQRARKLDLLMVSIGGNDISFAGLVAYAVLKDRTALRGLGLLTEDVVTPRQALEKLPRLEDRLHRLRRLIHTHLHIPWNEPDRIVMTAYPMIGLRADARTPCATQTAGVDVFQIYELNARRIAAAEDVAADLTRTMAKRAARYGWTFVDEHRERFAGRGVCAGIINAEGRSADELLFPRLDGEYWRPFAPSTFAPYAPRRRWIRTPNDTFLAAHVPLATDIRRRIFRRGRFADASPSDLLKATSYSGAFHPTAEGQAVIADAVVRAARQVLQRYGAH